ncbi:transposase [Streptomyces sp. NPDC059552]|uniref:transposase n=1 Tax=Streptomyces sp. NPDC059552 TaxID=3346862 RepID=UPI0036B7C174
MIDSQSIRTADTVPAAIRGFDAGKKVKGRERCIVTNTLGLLLAVHIDAASVQDRDGAKRPLLWSRLHHPNVKKVRSDQDFSGRPVEWAAWNLGRELGIVCKEPGQRASKSSPSRGR